MPRIYTVAFENQTFTAANTDYDMWELTPATNKPVKIMGFTLANLSEVGDAAEEMLRLAIVRGNATSGSGGASPTPAPLESSAGAAAGFTAETMNSTIASTGTAVTLFADGWNIRVPYQMFFPEELQPGASAANTLLVVRMLSTVADDVSVSGTLWVAELG